MASQIVRTLPASIDWLRSIPSTSAANDGRNARNSAAMVIPSSLKSLPHAAFVASMIRQGWAVLQPWRARRCRNACTAGAGQDELGTACSLPATRSVGVCGTSGFWKFMGGTDRPLLGRFEPLAGRIKITKKADIAFQVELRLLQETSRLPRFFTLHRFTPSLPFSLSAGSSGFCLRG